MSRRAVKRLRVGSASSVSSSSAPAVAAASAGPVWVPGARYRGTSTGKISSCSAPSPSTTSAMTRSFATEAGAAPSSSANSMDRSRKSVGRRPTTTSRRSRTRARRAAGKASRCSPKTTASPSTVATARFMAGDPIAAATNVLAGDPKSRLGVSTCWIVPSSITQTRSPRVIASIWSWVTYTVVTPRRSCRRASSARIETRSLASRLLSGSSMRYTTGSRTIARPIATRWRWPPESWPGRRSSRSRRPRTPATPPILSAMIRRGVRRRRSPNSRFSRTSMCG